MNEQNCQINISISMSTLSNRIFMAACALIVLGYILMSGPGSTESSFNPDIFSTRRIVIAPALCLAGYLLMIVGIIKK